jgi:hypothetical protein
VSRPAHSNRQTRRSFTPMGKHLAACGKMKLYPRRAAVKITNREEADVAACVVPEPLPPSP